MTIRALREKDGLRQDDLAEMVNIDQSYMSLIESEHRPANMKLLNKIARALGVPVAALKRAATAPEEIFDSRSGVA